MVLVERDGDAQAFLLPNVTADTLKGEIAVNVAKEAVVMTVELSSFTGAGKAMDTGRSSAARTSMPAWTPTVLWFTRTRLRVSSRC